MADKTIKRTIVAEWDDKMTAPIKRTQREFKKLSESAKKVKRENTALNRVVGKGREIFQRFGRAAKKAGDDAARAQKRARDEARKLRGEAQRLPGAFAGVGNAIQGAFAVGTIATFLRKLIAVSDQASLLEQSAREAAINAPGVPDEAKIAFGAIFERQAEAFERALNLEAGSIAQDFLEPFSQLFDKKIIDLKDINIERQVRETLLALIATQKAGGDPSTVTGGVTAFASLTGDTAFDALEKLTFAAQESGTKLNELADFIGRSAERTRGFATGAQLLGAAGGAVEQTGLAGREIRAIIEIVLMENQARQREGREGRFGAGSFLEQFAKAIQIQEGASDTLTEAILEAARGFAESIEAGAAEGTIGSKLRVSGIAETLERSTSRTVGDAFRGISKGFGVATDNMLSVWEDETTGFFGKWFGLLQAQAEALVLIPAVATFEFQRTGIEAGLATDLATSEVLKSMNETQEKLVTSIDTLNETLPTVAAGPGGSAESRPPVIIKDVGEVPQ